MTAAHHNILKEIHYYVGKHVKVPIHPHVILKCFPHANIANNLVCIFLILF